MRTLIAIFFAVLFAASVAGVRGQDAGPGIGLSQPVIRIGDTTLTALIQRPDVQGALSLGMRQRAALRDIFAANTEQRVMVSVRSDRGADPGAVQRQGDEQLRVQLSGRDTKVRAILKPEQWERLQQLELQWRGPLALADADVANRVDISGATRSKIAPIAAAYQKEKSEVLASLTQTREDTSPDGTRRTVAVRMDTSELDRPLSPARKRLEKAKRDADAQILAALTPEERERWKAACGEPFTFRADIKGHRF